MSWEIQFRKTEAQLDIKLASFLNPQSFANVDHIEIDINRLLDELTIIIDQAEQTISSSPSCKSSLISKVEFYQISIYSCAAAQSISP